MEYLLPSKLGDMSGKILYTIPLKMVDPLHRRLLIALPVPATAKNGGIDVGSYSWPKKDEVVARMQSDGYVGLDSAPVVPVDGTSELLSWKVCEGMIMALFSKSDQSLQSLYYLLPGSKPGSVLRVYQINTFDPKSGSLCFPSAGYDPQRWPVGLKLRS